jgi:hypothetical protein
MMLRARPATAGQALSIVSAQSGVTAIVARSATTPVRERHLFQELSDEYHSKIIYSKSVAKLTL